MVRPSKHHNYKNLLNGDISAATYSHRVDRWNVMTPSLRQAQRDICRDGGHRVVRVIDPKTTDTIRVCERCLTVEP